MRFRRFLFFTKCFTFGIFLRISIFGLFALRRRFFKDDQLINRLNLEFSNGISQFYNEKLPIYASTDFGERRSPILFSNGSTSRSSVEKGFSNDRCSMSTCFNFTRCRGRPFKGELVFLLVVFCFSESDVLIGRKEVLKNVIFLSRFRSVFESDFFIEIII